MNEVYIPPASQKTLLELARQTLEDFVREARRRVEEIDDSYLNSYDYGAFVSLHKREELRGCIGTCVPTLPLHRTVVEMTEAAASRDRRVEPISVPELGDIRIEITVLSPLEITHDPLSLEVGRHGLYIAQGGKRGVLLPQVATEYGWDMKTFLEQTCLKAGLRRHAWRAPDTKVSGFTALLIEESL